MKLAEIVTPTTRYELCKDETEASLLVAPKTRYQVFKDDAETSPMVWLAGQEIDSGEAFMCMLHFADEAMKCLYRMVDNNPPFVEWINRTVLGPAYEQI